MDGVDQKGGKIRETGGKKESTPGRVPSNKLPDGGKKGTVGLGADLWADLRWFPKVPAASKEALRCVNKFTITCRHGRYRKLGIL
ncbi:MAG: hypothetical protein EOO12_11395 [Chitinophagaceae bacterium]|nr:MAG: hypothetical protein EOO12_11395 [Chitinophagaceae bacterium]